MPTLEDKVQAVKEGRRNLNQCLMCDEVMNWFNCAPLYHNGVLIGHEHINCQIERKAAQSANERRQP